MRQLPRIQAIPRLTERTPVVLALPCTHPNMSFRGEVEECNCGHPISRLWRIGNFRQVPSAFSLYMKEGTGQSTRLKGPGTSVFEL